MPIVVSTSTLGADSAAMLAASRLANGEDPESAGSQLLTTATTGGPGSDRASLSPGSCGCGLDGLDGLLAVVLELWEAVAEGSTPTGTSLGIDGRKVNTTRAIATTTKTMTGAARCMNTKPDAQCSAGVVWGFRLILMIG